MKIALCITGSFCTFANLLKAVDSLVSAGYDVTPVFCSHRSPNRAENGQTPHKNHRRSRAYRKSRHRIDSRCALHGQYACKDCARHNRYARHNGCESHFAQQPPRRAERIVKRRSRRKRAQYRHSAQHPTRLFRAFRAGRSKQQSQLSHRRHKSDYPHR